MRQWNPKYKLNFGIPKGYDGGGSSGGGIADSVQWDNVLNKPSWVNSSTKPTYTAEEVGALPSTTTIPSKTSQLTNESGYTTSSSFKTINSESIVGSGNIEISGSSESPFMHIVISDYGISDTGEGTIKGWSGLKTILDQCSTIYDIDSYTIDAPSKLLLISYYFYIGVQMNCKVDKDKKNYILSSIIANDNKIYILTINISVQDNTAKYNFVVKSTTIQDINS